MMWSLICDSSFYLGFVEPLLSVTIQTISGLWIDVCIMSQDNLVVTVSVKL